jgi:hypothetical protein
MVTVGGDAPFKVTSMSCTVPVAAGVDVVDEVDDSVELDEASEEFEESEPHAAAARSSGATAQARARRTCVHLSGMAVNLATLASLDGSPKPRRCP